MKITTVIILFLSIISLLNSARAQNIPIIEWQRSFGGSGDDIATAIQQTSDSGFIVVGSSISYNGDVSGNNGEYDYWVVKLNQSGNLEWQKTYGGSMWDFSNSVCQTFDGGYIIVGRTFSNDSDVTLNHGVCDYWIVKIDAAGGLIWQKSLGGSSTDEATSVTQIEDSSYVISGFTFSQDGNVSGFLGYSDYWINRLDAEGNLDWQKCFGGTMNESPTSLIETSDGNIVVAGGTTSNDIDVSENHGDNDVWIIKINTNGDLIWQRSFGGTAGDEATAIQQTSDGGFILTGSTKSNDGDVSGNHSLYGYEDYWVMRLDGDGNLIWQKCLGGSMTDIGRAIQQTTDNGFIVIGQSDSNDGDLTTNYGGSDAWVVKLDENGNLIWQKSIGGTSDDMLLSGQQTLDGGYILAGASSSNDGDVSGNHGVYDFWIVKLSSDSTTGIPSVSNNFISLFPNPVQSQLTINLAIPANEITVHIYDVQGRMIDLPTSNLVSQTSNSLQLNTENLPSGFYTIQITEKKTGKIGVGKFVKQE